MCPHILSARRFVCRMKLLKKPLEMAISRTGDSSPDYLGAYVRTKGTSTHGSHHGCGLSHCSTASLYPTAEKFKYCYPQPTLSPVRHHLLLGSTHDCGRIRVSRQYAVSATYTSPVSYAYKPWPQNVKEKRQLTRPAGAYPSNKWHRNGVRMGMMLSAPAENDILFDDKLANKVVTRNKIWNAFRLIKGLGGVGYGSSA